ncbi:hypothetical protein RB213_010141 [Colletotrichum asianum]
MVTILQDIHISSLLFLRSTAEAISGNSLYQHHPEVAFLFAPTHKKHIPIFATFPSRETAWPMIREEVERKVDRTGCAALKHLQSGRPSLPILSSSSRRRATQRKTDSMEERYRPRQRTT